MIQALRSASICNVRRRIRLFRRHVARASSTRLSSSKQWVSRSQPGANVAALDGELAAMRRDLELLQQYAEQDAVHVDGVTVAAQ